MTVPHGQNNESGQRSIAFSEPLRITSEIHVVTVTDQVRNCHLVLHGTEALLVNCIPGLTPRAFQAAGFPAPREIWHTQVDDYLAAEGDTAATIRIPEEFREIALASDLYRQAAQTTWEKPEEWGLTRGRETYGFAGSILLKPLTSPISHFQTFQRGKRLLWNGLEFEVLDCSIRQMYGVAFALQINGVTEVIFCGELVCGCGKLPDIYGFEMDYTGIRWDQIGSAIEEMIGRNSRWLFASSGQPLEYPKLALQPLAGILRELIQIEPAPRFPQPEPTRLGRYYDHGDGIYQMTDFGNVILLINEEGTGLIVDPGPCDYENPHRIDDFRKDLIRFEEEAGLRKIDLALVTHFHGDHYDLWPVVQQRYPACRLATWAPVAEILEEPSRFPYAAQLPWYAVGWTSCKADIRTTRLHPFDWHGQSIHTIHLPGHCLAHAGFWMDWRGRRIAFTGDLVQVRGEADTLKVIPSNHWLPGAEGHDGAYETLLPLNMELNLSGHSIYFGDCSAVYAESLRRMTQSINHVRKLVCDESAAYLRPSLQPAAEYLRAIIAKT